MEENNKKPLRFFTAAESPSLIKKFKPKTVPCFLLNKDRWDDFGIQCQFQLYYFDEKTTAHRIGDIKILHRQLESTELPKEFNRLDEGFISLGQELEFYESLVESCGEKLSIEVLEALKGSTPILRTLQRSLIMGKRSVYVKEKKIQPRVQAWCC